jgi:3-oxoacyl-[acyl-carrier protein] reductase
MTKTSIARRAIITGGSGGIGQAIAARLRAAGLRIAVFDRVPPTGGSAACDLYCACDVTDERSVESAVADVIAKWGGVDVLVNNAGILGPVAPAASVPLDDWRRVIDINLTGAFICSKAVVPHMVARGWGRIVNMSSVQGKEGTAEAAPYAASKAALIALAKSMAKELATTGITVNCVTPTVVDGGMIASITPQRRAELLAKIPMQRFCTVDEVAAMVAWIASDDCSFTTGAVFDLSGGRATW